jgi:hypothetical protein
MKQKKLKEKVEKKSFKKKSKKFFKIANSQYFLGDVAQPIWP